MMRGLLWESNNEIPFSSAQGGERTQPIVLIAQLMQEAAHMRHIDEVFSWLAQAMAQRWHIPVVHLWSEQNYRTGQVQTELRAAASQNPALPQQVHMNHQTPGMVEHFLREQKSSLPLPVTNILPASQAQMLVYYQLNYWAGYFLKNDELLLPVHGEFYA